MADQLTYVFITPRALRKGRAGGILGRLLSRSGLELHTGKVFAPSAKLLGDLSGSLSGQPATQEYLKVLPPGSQSLVLVLKGSDAVAKVAAIVVALITTLAVTVSRVAAALLARRAGTGPHVIILIAAALIVAVSALTVQHRTNEGILFIVTSGEEFISKLPTLTVTSTVVAILIFKAIAYAVSLGSGFRGGPFFPAMFIGASAGLIVSLTMGSTGPSVPAAIVVGVVASLIATAHDTRIASSAPSGRSASVSG